MKSMQIIAHTTGGEVRSAVDQVTERDFEAIKEVMKSASNSTYVEFNTDNGWVVIPGSQILYVEIQVY